MTTDIDFAILVNDENQYNEIRQCLINTEKILEDDEPYRFRNPSGVIVDNNHQLGELGRKYMELFLISRKVDWDFFLQHAKTKPNILISDSQMIVKSMCSEVRKYSGLCVSEWTGKHPG